MTQRGKNILERDDEEEEEDADSKDGPDTLSYPWLLRVSSSSFG